MTYKSILTFTALYETAVNLMERNKDKIMKNIQGKYDLFRQFVYVNFISFLGFLQCVSEKQSFGALGKTL